MVYTSFAKPDPKAAFVTNSAQPLKRYGVKALSAEFLDPLVM